MPDRNPTSDHPELLPLQDCRTEMEYDFKLCKLCRQTSRPLYRLHAETIYCCTGCDFHYLDRLDDIPALQRNAQPLTKRARRYIESRADESSRLHPSRLSFLNQFIATTDVQLLDIGAGLGQFQRLAQQQGIKACGIEPSGPRRRYAAETFGLQLHGETIETSFWQDNYRDFFDVITLWDVIEHVNFPRETLELALNLLKPGGLLLLDTPSRDTFPYRLSQAAYRISGGKLSLFLPSFYSAAPYGHKQIFTPAQLNALLAELGLDILCRQQSYGARPQRGDKLVLAARKQP